MDSYSRHGREAPEEGESRSFIGFEMRSQIMQFLASDPEIRAAMECIVEQAAMLRLLARSSDDGEGFILPTTNLRAGHKPKQETDLARFASRHETEKLSILACLFGRAGDYDEKTLARVRIIRRLADALYEAQNSPKTAAD